MNYRLPFLLYFVVIALSSCSQSISERDYLYELSWHDEFDGKVLNDSIWSKIKRDSGARCFCNLTSDDRMYKMGKGRLRLYARHNNGILPNDTARFLT